MHHLNLGSCSEFSSGRTDLCLLTIQEQGEKSLILVDLVTSSTGASQDLDENKHGDLSVIPIVDFRIQKHCRIVTAFQYEAMKAASLLFKGGPSTSAWSRWQRNHMRQLEIQHCQCCICPIDKYRMTASRVVSLVTFKSISIPDINSNKTTFFRLMPEILHPGEQVVLKSDSLLPSNVKITVLLSILQKTKQPNSFLELMRQLLDAR